MIPDYEHAKTLVRRYARDLTEDEIMERLIDEGFSAWGLTTNRAEGSLRRHFEAYETDKMWAQMPKECHVCGSRDLYSPNGLTVFAFCETCGREKGFIGEE